MKKTTLLMIISLGFLNPFNAKSQTKEQTIGWLKGKSGSLLFAQYYALDFDQNGAVRMSYPQSPSNWDIIQVNFSMVTGVSYVKQAANGNMPEAYMITLGGTFIKFRASDSKEYTNASNISMSYIGVDENEIKRIAKAYEHLATLCGAKVVSDDLFKN